MTFTEISSSAPILTPEQEAKLREEINTQPLREHQAYKESEWLKLCPSEYDKPLDYSKIDPGNHAKVRAIVEWKQYPKGLFIIGPTGRAKTRACWQVIKPRWYAGASVVVASSIKIARDAVKAVTDHEEGGRVISRYVNADILLLDDLGKRLTPATIQFLFEVIERRTSNGKAIIATSNEDYKTLAEKIDDGSGTMSEPIIRRLEEFCDLVVLP